MFVSNYSASSSPSSSSSSRSRRRKRQQRWKAGIVLFLVVLTIALAARRFGIRAISILHLEGIIPETTTTTGGGLDVVDETSSWGEEYRQQEHFIDMDAPGNKFTIKSSPAHHPQEEEEEEEEEGSSLLLQQQKKKKKKVQKKDAVATTSTLVNGRGRWNGGHPLLRHFVNREGGDGGGGGGGGHQIGEDDPNNDEDARKVVLLRERRGRRLLLGDGEPVFLAEYPGSGSTLTIKLFRAITGSTVALNLDSSSSPSSSSSETPTPTTTSLLRHSSLSDADVLFVKTHYPTLTLALGGGDDGGENNLLPSAPSPSSVDIASLLPRALILIRNPLDAISSYANFDYENDVLGDIKNHHHTRGAPESYWITWRDSKFDIQLDRWRDHLEYWMDHGIESRQDRSQRRLVVPYEYQIDTIAGPIMSERIARFLGTKFPNGEGWMTSIPQHWKEVVGMDGGERPTKRIKTHPSRYTTEQLEDVTWVLSRLIRKYQDMEEEYLVQVLKGYLKIVHDRGGGYWM